MDFKKIYESTMEEGDRRFPERFSKSSPTEAVQFLTAPVDLNNEMKLFLGKRFQPAAEIFSHLPVKGCFGTFAFGEGMDLTVDYSKPVKLFSDGAAQIQLAPTDRYYEAVDMITAARSGMRDYDAEVKQAMEKASADYEKQHPFDAEDVYRLRDSRSKTSMKNREQAIAKKRSAWQKSMDSAAKAAADEVTARRNKAVLDSGVSQNSMRMISNGSLLADADITLYWYPTVMDLARMFDRRISIPTDYFIRVNDNDDTYQPAQTDSVLAESWSGVTDGGLAFNDIRDSVHLPGDKFGEQYRHMKLPFPIVKKDRWNRMLQIWNVQQIPLSKLSSLSKDIYYDRIHNTLSVGKTGRILYKMKLGETPPIWAIMTVDAVIILYRDPDTSKPFTAYFVLPSKLADVMKLAENRPDTVSINMIRNSCQNLIIGQNEQYDMFTRKAGTRRYIK